MMLAVFAFRAASEVQSSKFLSQQIGRVYVPHLSHQSNHKRIHKIKNGTTQLEVSINRLTLRRLSMKFTIGDPT